MPRKRTSLAAVTLTLAVAATTIATTATPASAATTCHSAKIIYWYDGDTVNTSIGKIRLIGVDTPEVGRPGASTAKWHAKAMAPYGSWVKVCDPSSVRNTDKYGRLLRYVKSTKGYDVGRAQILKGGRAYYDSRQGYDWHPWQSWYIGTDMAYPNYRGGWSTTSSSTTTSCNIKGNISSSGERIYHLPGQQYYSVTVINTSAGERWFCTEGQALDAGWRKSKV